eukprot:10089540-Alexandrium_andersonii.AAC.1
MSASLVGSEMCIRDRPGIARLTVEDGEYPVVRDAAWRAAGVSVPDRPPCLLYTSDAADDM